MSDRPMTTCRDCGLEVYARPNGHPVRHVRQAVQAGHKDAECVRRVNEADKRRREKGRQQRRWEQDYRALREQRSNAETSLPKHLR